MAGGRQDHKEAIVELSTWGMCLSNRVPCRRAGRKEEGGLAWGILEIWG